MIEWIPVSSSTRIVAEAYDPETETNLRAVSEWRRVVVRRLSSSRLGGVQRARTVPRPVHP